jgi:hypothetical protein
VISFAFRRKIRAEIAAVGEFAEAYRSGAFLLLLDAPPLAPCNENEIQGSEVVSMGGGKVKKWGPFGYPSAPCSTPTDIKKKIGRTQRS